MGPGGPAAGDPPAVRRLQRLEELIAGSPHNLVSSRERTRLSVHVAEALAVGALLELRPGSRWLDLGTGGGLPGLPLAIGWPDVGFWLLDARRKKIEAVRAFATELGLANVEVCWGRAEDLGVEPGLRGRFDGVVARAVAPLPELAAWSAPFLRAGGVLAAIKGPHWKNELGGTGPTDAMANLVFTAALPVPAAVRPTVVVKMQKAA